MLSVANTASGGVEEDNNVMAAESALVGITAINDPVRVNSNIRLFRAGFITRETINRHVIIEWRMQTGNFFRPF